MPSQGSTAGCLTLASPPCQLPSPTPTPFCHRLGPMSFLDYLCRFLEVSLLLMMIFPPGEGVRAAFRRSLEHLSRVFPRSKPPILEIPTDPNPYLSLTTGDLERLNHLPPELLQEIFAQYCDEEYIDIFRHVYTLAGFVLADGVALTDPASTLMAVCLRWEVLVKQTPQLWRNFCLDTTFPLGCNERLMTNNPAVELFRKVLKNDILIRSQGLPLHIRLQGKTHHPFQSLLRTLMESSSRWSSLELACDDRVYFAPDPESPLFHPFENLKSITIEANCRVSVYSRLRYTLSGPKLNKVVFHALGTRYDDSNPRILKNLMHRWDTITTLVMSFTKNPPLVSQIALALQTMQDTLLHLEWHRTQDIVEGHLAPIVLPKLRSLIIAEPAPFEYHPSFCSHILLFLSCPNLEIFKLLLFQAVGRPKPAIDHGFFLTAREAIEYLLSRSPGLAQTTIILAPSFANLNRAWRTHPCLYLTGIQSQLEELVRTRALSTNGRGGRTVLPLSLLSLFPSQHDMKAMLARMMSFAPRQCSQSVSNCRAPHSSDAIAWVADIFAHVNSVTTSGAWPTSDIQPRKVEDSVYRALDVAEPDTMRVMIDFIDMVSLGAGVMFPSACALTVACM
ncbi:hypothetical protein DFP72DRAFT_913506, partial [Ephemerocybe angulata]